MCTVESIDTWTWGIPTQVLTNLRFCLDIFSQVSDPAGIMIYSQFDLFLREVLKLPVTVFEGPSFGYTEQTTRTCFPQQVQSAAGLKAKLSPLFAMIWKRQVLRWTCKYCLTAWGELYNYHSSHRSCKSTPPQIMCLCSSSLHRLDRKHSVIHRMSWSHEVIRWRGGMIKPVMTCVDAEFSTDETRLRNK